MARIAASVLALAFALTLPSYAAAGIADDPVPPLQGQSARTVYSLTGVINNGNLATYVACTNVDGGDVRVGVQVFGAAGTPFNDPSPSSLLLPPGVTKMFGTATAAGLSIDSILAPGITPLGSARILATSTRIICTAFLMDANNTIPNSGWSLTIVAKTKQKAAN
jgi:hypothetical protein